MTKVNFTKNTNFWELASFSKIRNFDNFSLLKQAYNQKVLIEDNKRVLKKFIDSFKTFKVSKSQLYQDVFASFIVDGKFEKTFLEFGATNGIDLSNSYSLETFKGWTGVLSEPSPQWHHDLIKNRNKAKIITKCIWSQSEKKLDFFVSDVGALSTIKDFVDSDKSSMPGNTAQRKKGGKTVSVETISLNDVIKEYFNDEVPSYISVDTEGSEYEILKSFDLNVYRPKLLTIEHNFTDQQKHIDSLMKNNNYERIFEKLTLFDAWYVSSETLKELDF